MTDEYFFIEEISPNSSEIESEKSNDDKNKSLPAVENGDTYSLTEKNSQGNRLHGKCILEIEQQLSMAESRCNTLKGQVDYMKMLYNGMNSKDPESNKSGKVINKPTQIATTKRHLVIDTSAAKRKRNDMAEQQLKKMLSVENYNTEPPSRERDVDLHQHQARSNMLTVLHRDQGDLGNDRPCERDANAAVKSINNIISGITNSVNRLTQLQVHIGSSSTTANNTNSNNIAPDDAIGIQDVKCSRRYTDQNTAAEKPYQTEHSTFTTGTDPKQSSDSSMKSKTFKKKRRIKGRSTSKQSMASTSDVKKNIKVTAKHTEKKTKIHQSFTGADITQLTASRVRKKPFGKLRTISSRTLLMKKSMNSYNKPSKPEKKEWKCNKLIELYHNSNVKDVTPSEDSIPNKKVGAKLVTNESKARSQQSQISQQAIPPVYEKQGTVPQTFGPNDQTLYRPPLSPINEQEMHYGANGSYYHNYELPTIASKMKQVAKSYFQNFNFKTIPFVAAKSITPSHNLGVNIQQVLSIIKGKKPVAGISPTLAYNIELAANKLGSRPLSALISNLGSRMNSNRNICPLARRYPFSHLQEIAKQIPEETIEEINALYEEDGTKILPEISMAAGDKDEEIQGKNWYTESKTSEKCTCLPKQGVSFNDVYSKYTAEDKPVRKGVPTMPIKRVRHRPWNENKRSRPLTMNEVFQQQPNLYNCGSRSSQINKRERSLKEVLKNLHDEFASLTDRYEDLKGQTSSSHTLLTDIDKMEKELQNKEDEITMVMTLYKEVMTLKQQVRVLKTRASQSTVLASPFINRSRDYKDLNAAGHLTKLLRHIQQFQETLKTKNTR